MLSPAFPEKVHAREKSKMKWSFFLPEECRYFDVLIHRRVGKTSFS